MPPYTAEGYSGCGVRSRCGRRFFDDEIAEKKKAKGEKRREKEMKEKERETGKEKKDKGLFLLRQDIMG